MGNGDCGKSRKLREEHRVRTQGTVQAEQTASRFGSRQDRRATVDCGGAIRWPTLRRLGRPPVAGPPPGTRLFALVACLAIGWALEGPFGATAAARPGEWLRQGGLGPPRARLGRPSETRGGQTLS